MLAELSLRNVCRCNFQITHNITHHQAGHANGERRMNAGAGGMVVKRAKK